jgi:hypothetical protein
LKIVGIELSLLILLKQNNEYGERQVDTRVTLN